MTVSLTIRKRWSSWDSGGEYKLNFLPSNPIETATAKLWKEQHPQNIKLGAEQIKWVGLEGLSTKKIRNLFLNLDFDSEFEVNIDLNSPFQMTIRLKRLTQWNLLSLQSSSDLALHLSKGVAPNRDIALILSKMVSQFTLGTHLPLSFNEEILAIFPYATDQEKKAIAHTLLVKQLEGKCLTWTGRDVQIILNYLHLQNSLVSLKQAKRGTTQQFKDLPTAIPLFRPEECVRILELINPDPYVNEGKALPPLLLDAINIFVEMLQASALKDYYQKEYQKFYTQIESCQNKITQFCLKNLSVHKDREDLQRDFYLKYGTSLLKVDATLKTEKNQILERWFEIATRVKASSTLTLRPWQFLIDQSKAGISFEERASQFESRHEPWMCYLVLLEGSFLSDDPESSLDFRAFQLSIKRNDHKLALALPFNHYFFVQGLLKVLKIIIDTQPLSGGMAQDAQAILETIQLSNQTPKNSSMLFKVEHSQKLADEAEEYAKQALSPAFGCSSPSLFVKALQDHIPWIEALRNMKERLIDKKEQESSFSFALQIKKEVPSTSSELDLFKNLRSLLKNKSNKVILIRGPEDCGKTPFLKHFALRYLNKYRAKTDPIAFFISFNSVKNPVKGLVDQTLEHYALYPYKYEFKSIPTLWIVDGVDPLTFNLYQTNEFESWPNAQLVISCRKESLEEGYQQHLDPFSKIRAPELERNVYYKELEIAPSNEERAPSSDPFYSLMTDKKANLNTLKTVAPEKFIAALDKEPSQAALYSNLGRILPLKGSIQLLNGTCMSKQELYLKAIDLDPKNSYAYNNLGTTLADGASIQLLNGTRMSLQELYLKAIDLDPKSSNAYINLGNTLAAGDSIQLLNGTRMSEQELFLKAIDLDPKNSNSYTNLANSLAAGASIQLLNGTRMSEQELYLKAIDLDPKNSNAYINLATLAAGASIQLLNGTRMSKQELYLKAIDLDPKCSNAYHNLATTLAAGASIQLLNGTRLSQQELYLKAIDLNSNYFVAYYNLATTLAAGASIQLLNGTRMSQQELYLKAIDLNPNYFAAYTNLGNTLAAGDSIQLLNGTRMSKQELYLKAIDLDPKDADAYHSLANTLAAGASIQLLNGTRMTKEQLLSKEEDSTQIKSRFFEPVFKNKFPWIEALSLQNKLLCEDRDLKENKGYVVKLKGSDPRQGKKPIEDLVDSVLDNGQKVTVIVGEAGSGKSLFVKSYVKDRLDKYQIDKPVPLFAALRTIKDPEKNLILEILKQYNLGRDDIGRLKELPTVWFLDGYDEIFLGNSRHPFNIYQSNDLDKWPNANFVFTCRKKLLNSGDENNYFAPMKKTVKLIQVVPFEEPDVNQFLDNYIATKQGITPGWNKAKFQFAIKTLGLSDVIVNPFFLRQVVDYLSGLVPELVSDKKEKLDTESRDKKHSLLDLIISDSIIRESERTSGMVSPKTYCEFIIEIARLMQICQQPTVAEQTTDQQTEQRCQRDLQKSELEASRNIEMLEKVKNEKAIRGAPSNSKTKQDLEEALAGNVSNIAHLNDGLKRVDLLFQAEQRLQTLLFSDAYRYLHTGPLIKQNDRGEKEFGHVVIYQYFVGLLRDDAAKQRLLNLCNATA